MEFNAQIIRIGNINEFAVLLYDEFKKMKEMIEYYEDLLQLRNVKSKDILKKGKSAISLYEELSK